MAAGNRINSDDYSVLIQIIVWFLLTTTALSFVARTGTKLLVKKIFFEWDDILISLSFIFNIGESVAIAIAAVHGLGRSASLSAPAEIETAQKAQYAGSLLAVLSLCTSRLAFLSLVLLLTPVKEHKRRCCFVSVIVIAWAFVSFVTSAFQCEPPAVWDYTHSRCLDRTAWYIALDAVNSLIDATLVILAGSVIFSLQSRPGRKIVAMLNFSLRIVVIGASICDAIFWARLRKSEDVVRDIWPIIITSQCVVALSIVTVSALYLKPFMEMLQTGFLRLDDTQRRTGSTANDTPIKESYKLSFSTWGRRRTLLEDQSLGTLNEIIADHAKRPWGRDSYLGRDDVILAERTWALETSSNKEFQADESGTSARLE